MKTKIITQIKLKVRGDWVKLLAYTASGWLFSLGEAVPRSSPFAIALMSTCSGFSPALATLIGALIGSVGRPFGYYHAISVAVIFLARLILGSWLSSPTEGTGETVKRSTDEPALKRILSLVRGFLRDAAEVSFRESIYIRMALGAVAAVMCGASICAAESYSSEALVGTVVTVLGCPMLVWLYFCAIRQINEGEDAPWSGGGFAAEAGRLALALTVVLSLRGITDLFDAAVPAAFAITLIITRGRGLLCGILYGIVCGVVLSPAMVPMCALAALASGGFWRLSPAVAVTSGCVVGALWSFYTMGLSAMSLVIPELVITSAVLAPVLSSPLLPPVKGTGSEASAKAKEGLASMMLRRESAKRMHLLSKSMKDLSGVLYRLSDRLTCPETEELCELCEGSFEEHCRSCGMRSACFGREGEQMAELQARMTLALKREGRVGAGMIPAWLIKRCYNIGQIIDYVNAGYARMVSESKLYDRTGVVAADYEVMSEMLGESAEYDGSEFDIDSVLTAKSAAALRGKFDAESVAVFGKRVKRVVVRGVNVGNATPPPSEIRELFSRACGLELSEPEFELDGSQVLMKLQSLPSFAVRCGRASVAKSETGKTGKSDSADAATRVFSAGVDRRGLGKTASEDCGDVISAFLTDDGRFFMLISDGMGSGKEAAVTSGICAVFIEKLLRAGASMDTSLKMLNSMMRVRSGEISATVDLMELDLMNGKTRFVKSGAAPSFVLRGGRLFRLQSKTVPIGIVRALDAEMIKFETEPGDIIVMLSDGVVKSFEDCPWLYDMLCDENEWCEDPEKMARKIVKRAIDNGAQDDITAGVVMVS